LVHAGNIVCPWHVMPSCILLHTWSCMHPWSIYSSWENSVDRPRQYSFDLIRIVPRSAVVTGVVMHAGLHHGAGSHTTERHVLPSIVQVSARYFGAWYSHVDFGSCNPCSQCCLFVGSCQSARSEAASDATLSCLAENINSGASADGNILLLSSVIPLHIEWLQG
jgi:hypothetical protein